jgi:hypothetical protein
MWTLCGLSMPGTDRLPYARPVRAFWLAASAGTTVNLKNLSPLSVLTPTLFGTKLKACFRF